MRIECELSANSRIGCNCCNVRSLTSKNETSSVRTGCELYANWCVTVRTGCYFAEDLHLVTRNGEQPAAQTPTVPPSPLSHFAAFGSQNIPFGRPLRQVPLGGGAGEFPRKKTKITLQKIGIDKNVFGPHMPPRRGVSSYSQTFQAQYSRFQSSRF